MPASHLKPKRILVAPLDWGLGHATRCIPLIRELLVLGCEVLIGAEGRHAALLREEFPGLQILPLPGYGITYSRRPESFGLKMIGQVPRLQRAVGRENRWLRKTVTEYRIDAVISDNRLGLHHPEIPCVILTHQLLIKSPFHAPADRWLQKINYHFINKFRECWVVDFEGPDNFAGELSHPRHKPQVPLKYIGTLSRFGKKPGMEKRYDLLALVSGPEPQRTCLEQLFLQQLPGLPLNSLLVSGRPGELFDRRLSDNVRYVSHLGADALNDAFCASDLIIGRAGYTTVMDLAKLGKKAILIPTPGQTEQEYLASFLQEQGYFFCVPQKSLQLAGAIESAAGFPYKDPSHGHNMETFKPVLAAFVASL